VVVQCRPLTLTSPSLIPFKLPTDSTQDPYINAEIIYGVLQSFYKRPHWVLELASSADATAYCARVTRHGLRTRHRQSADRDRQRGHDVRRQPCSARSNVDGCVAVRDERENSGDAKSRMVSELMKTLNPALARVMASEPANVRTPSVFCRLRGFVRWPLGRYQNGTAAGCCFRQPVQACYPPYATADASASVELRKFGSGSVVT